MAMCSCLSLLFPPWSSLYFGHVCTYTYTGSRLRQRYARIGTLLPGRAAAVESWTSQPVVTSRPRDGTGGRYCVRHPLPPRPLPSPPSATVITVLVSLTLLYLRSPSKRLLRYGPMVHIAATSLRPDAPFIPPNQPLAWLPQPRHHGSHARHGDTGRLTLHPRGRHDAGVLTEVQCLLHAWLPAVGTYEDVLWQFKYRWAVVTPTPGSRAAIGKTSETEAHIRTCCKPPVARGANSSLVYILHTTEY